MESVSMFVPCSIDLLLPETGKSLYYLLKHLGKKPYYHKEQTCCGQPAFNAGYREKAKTAAKHFISVFEEDEIIVGLSGSCINTVKKDYPEILKDEPEWRIRAEKTGEKIFELSSYLVDVLEIKDLGAVSNSKICYHDSCQLLRELGIKKQPLTLLEKVKECEILPLNGADSCCGFGGEFSLNYPSISEAIVKEKTDNFINSGADTLILSDPGCLLNVKGYLSKHYPEKNAMHIADFLWSATGGSHQ